MNNSRTTSDFNFIGNTDTEIAFRRSMAKLNERIFYFLFNFFPHREGTICFLDDTVKSLSDASVRSHLRTVTTQFANTRARRIHSSHHNNILGMTRPSYRNWTETSGPSITPVREETKCVKSATATSATKGLMGMADEWEVIY
jgi:uncharacterized protein with von Willebrand factor type A (vWA) domain